MQKINTNWEEYVLKKNFSALLYNYILYNAI